MVNRAKKAGSPKLPLNNIIDGEYVPWYATIPQRDIELWKKDASIDTTKVVEEQMYIRARYKDGDSVTTNASPYIDLGTECEINSKNLEFPTKSCPLSTFKNMLTKQTFTSLYAWCNACSWRWCAKGPQDFGKVV